MARRLFTALLLVAACNGTAVAAPTEGPHAIVSADGETSTGPPHCCR